MNKEQIARLMTGHKAIDEEHITLIRQVDELYEAMKSGKGKEHIEQILNFLGEYTINHFQNEEKLYAKYHYPRAREHKVIHDDFINQLKQIKKETLENEITTMMAINVNKVANNWLRNHIGKEDKEAVEFLNKNM